MDRASDSGSEGWGFESLPVYQAKERIPIRVSSLFASHFVREGTRKGERSERCLWQNKRGERVAAVDKIEERREPNDFIGLRNRTASAHTGAKIESWRAIFSPWESP